MTALVVSVAALTGTAAAIGILLKFRRDMEHQLSPYTLKGPLTLAVARLDVKNGDTIAANVDRRLADDEAQELYRRVQCAAREMFGETGRLNVVLFEDGVAYAGSLGPGQDGEVPRRGV